MWSIRPRLSGILLVAAVLAGPVLVTACQEPAGPPPTLESGVVTFLYDGVRFTAEGRCYDAIGYEAADSSCALALDLGDTLRVRGARDPRTNRWVHINVELPESGECAEADACRIAFDYLSRTGKVERSFRSSTAEVIIEERTEDRVRGTFTGQIYPLDLTSTVDTLPLTDGAFDVPVVR